VEQHNAQPAAGEIIKCESSDRPEDGDAVDTCFQAISFNSDFIWATLERQCCRTVVINRHRLSRDVLVPRPIPSSAKTASARALASLLTQNFGRRAGHFRIVNAGDYDERSESRRA
jgi:hypothetical protein